MGFLWFGSIFIYGFGASLLGASGTVYGWAGIIAVSILTTNFWGVVTGEWSGSGLTTKIKMAASTVLLILAFVILSAHRATS
jgi:L-rhamnose-H+ transport protein